jgi:hypothetical protein
MNQNQSPNKIRIVFLTGITVGILDIVAAILKFYIETGKGPEPIFRYIASGVFGRSAFTEGKEMIAWGLVFHFIIALLFTTMLLLVFSKVYAIFRNWVVVGILYGIVIWAAMNFIVVPMSEVPKPKFDLVQALIAAAILIFMIGLPVAYVGKKWFKSW